MVHVPLMFLSEWREFPSAPCLAGKRKKFMTTRISMLLKSRASPDMLPFNLCNKKWLEVQHMNRPLFPTTLSIPSYDNGKYVGLRTYQHPLVLNLFWQKKKVWVCGLDSLVQNNDQWWAVVNTVMNFRVSYRGGSFLAAQVLSTAKWGLVHRVTL